MGSLCSRRTRSAADESLTRTTNVQYFVVQGAKGGHCQHTWYAEFVLNRLRESHGPLVDDVITRKKFWRLPAMFQHNMEKGPTDLRDTLSRRSKLLKIHLAGNHWKVLVFGCAIPWQHYRRTCDMLGADYVQSAFDNELQVLHKTLIRKHIDNFALYGIGTPKPP